MEVQQLQISAVDDLAARLAQLDGAQDAGLVLAFGPPELIRNPITFAAIKQACPHAEIMGCSTAGEITAKGIADNSLVLTLARFSTTSLQVVTTDLASMDDSASAGMRLGRQLAGPGLKAVLVFGQGVSINGSALIAGLAQVVGEGVPITGGLAGDGSRFRETAVLTPAGPSTTAIVALGLRGDALQFSHGSFGGWEPFGTQRRVTRAAGNILFELDGKPALEIYKQYLGEYARDLPSSGLLFPFEMIDRARSSTGVIRTILGIDETAGSLTLAGDIDPDGYLQLMHSSSDRLVTGAEAAALAAQEMSGQTGGGIGILISCVGRKLVMGERVDEEIEAVGEILGQSTTLTGFYSYGEISPFAPGSACRLHNQTMTITWIGERP